MSRSSVTALSSSRTTSNPPSISGMKPLLFRKASGRENFERIAENLKKEQGRCVSSRLCREAVCAVAIPWGKSEGIPDVRRIPPVFLETAAADRLALPSAIRKPGRLVTVHRPGSALRRPVFHDGCCTNRSGNWIVVDMGGENARPCRRAWNQPVFTENCPNGRQPLLCSALLLLRPYEPFRLHRVSSFMDTNLLDRMLRPARDSSPGHAVVARTPPTFVRGSGSSCQCHASPSRRRKSCGTSL